MAKIAPAPIREDIATLDGRVDPRTGDTSTLRMRTNRVWVQWFTDQFNRINERIEQITGVITGNIPLADADGSLTDSGYSPTTLPHNVHTHESDTQGGPLDHGDALTGLAGDDHVQYHTDTRGDARYLYRENVGVFTPDADYEPATKKYVDDRTAATQADMAASEAHIITDPADTPATADALRDDLVANTIPDIESKLNALGVEINKVNALIDKLQAAGLMT